MSYLYNKKIFCRHVLERVRYLIGLPLLIFYLNIIILLLIMNTSGNESSYLSPGFELGLKDNRFSGGIYAIPLYSNIKMKFVTSGEYILSTELNYPRVYPDGRISSAGPIVSSFKDIVDSSYWRIIPVGGNRIESEYEEAMNNPDYVSREVVMTGDKFVLKNKATGKYLLFQDVASRYEPMDLEISCSSQDSPEFVDLNSNLLLSLKPGIPISKSIIFSEYTKLLLISPGHRSSLTHSDKRHPELQGRYADLRGVRFTQDPGIYITVEAILPLGADKESFSSTNRVNSVKGGSVKKNSIFLSSLELFLASVFGNLNVNTDQSITSSPYSWPIQSKTFSFWRSEVDRNKISYVGNPIIWPACLTATVLSPFIIICCLFERKLKLNILRYDTSSWILNTTGYLFTYWLMHWVLFFLVPRNLYAHHYLVSFITSILLLATLFNSLTLFSNDVISHFIHIKRKKVDDGNIVADYPKIKTWTASVMVGIACVFTAGALYGSWTLLPITYGKWAPGVDNLKALNWRTLPDIIEV